MTVYEGDPRQNTHTHTHTQRKGENYYENDLKIYHLLIWKIHKKEKPFMNGIKIQSVF